MRIAAVDDKPLQPEFHDRAPGVAHLLLRRRAHGQDHRGCVHGRMRAPAVRHFTVRPRATRGQRSIPWYSGLGIMLTPVDMRLVML